MKNKIILIGDGGVGKTSLAIRYIADRFEVEYDPTIEESFYKEVDTPAGKLKLEILDTAGQDDFSAIRQEYYRKADCVIGVFDVENLMTFNKLQDFWKEIVEERQHEGMVIPPIIAVGNKIDLIPNFKNDDVDKWLNDNSINIVYTSASLNQNINDLFDKAVELLLKVPLATESNVVERKSKKNSKCLLF